jgi:hypothetical protein
MMYSATIATTGMAAPNALMKMLFIFRRHFFAVVENTTVWINGLSYDIVARNSFIFENRMFDAQRSALLLLNKRHNFGKLLEKAETCS